MAPAPRVHPVAGSLGLAAAYWAAAWVGFQVATVNSSVSPVWAPSGIAIGALIVWGRRLWPGVFVGALLANLANTGLAALQDAAATGGWPHAAALLGADVAIAAGNTLEAVAACILVKRLANGRAVFDTARGAARFALLGAALPAVASASVGVAALALAGGAEPGTFSTVWTTWWLGDTTGTLLVAPLIVLFAIGHDRTEARPLEATVILLGAAVLAALVFTPLGGSWSHLPLTFLLVPPVAWSAFRLRRAEAAATAALVAAIAVGGTVSGNGPFVSVASNTALLILQTFASLVGLTAIMLASVVRERDRTLTDISERRRMEARLARDLQQVEEAERATSRGSWTWDLDADRAVWSTGMYRLFGVDAATFDNTNENFLAVVHPDDRPRMGAAMADALAHGGRFLQDYRVVRPDGSIRYIRGEGQVLLGEAGQARRMFGFVQDVTELRELERQAENANRGLEEAERRFRTLFAMNPVAMSIARAQDSRILDVNAAYERILGYRKEEVMAPGFDATRLWADPERRPAILASLQRDPDQTFELRLRHKEGAIVDVLATIRALELGGTPARLTAMIDVTGARRAQEEARQEREARIANEAELGRLRRNEEFLAGFVNTTAHELTTPLTPMVLQMRVLEEAPEKARPEAIALLARNVERMRKVVEGIVTAARTQAGQANLHLADVRLGEVVRELVAATARAGTPGVGADGPDVAVHADLEALRKVLGNLLDNAARFTPAAGRVDVRWTQEGDKVRVAVRDTGIGIAPDKLRLLFRPYGQADQEVRTESGIGLGLYVVGRLVALMGGEVGASSEGLGKGSTFWFTLPAARPPASTP